MKSIGAIALLLVVTASLVGAAQCGCGQPEPANCYLVFKTTETIVFTLEAPIDYFMVHQTSTSPRIFGWRVETSDGTVVRTVIYPGEPRGRWLAMEWDLVADDGYIVAPGDYNIIVMTTVSDVSYPVRIVDACRPLFGCCNVCYAPVSCDIPCCIPYGELYLTLGVGEVRPCSGLSFSLTITIECSSP